MRGVRGSTSGSPRTPVLSARRPVPDDTGDGRDEHCGPHHQHDEEHRVSVEEHREAVVRRLLADGLSPTTVVALLPDFRPLVERLTEDD